MEEPIKAGDHCIVIDGMLGDKSPNLGLHVVVLAFVGDHSQFGRMWRCQAEYGEAGQELAGVPGDQLDFAQPWLKKKPKKKEPAKELTAEEKLERDKMLEELSERTGLPIV